MARIEVEIDLEEYLWQIETGDLVRELARRKGNSNEVITLIRNVLGLREWHGKDDIIKEINLL